MMLTPRIPSRCRMESRMVFIPSNIPVNLCKIGTIRNKTRLCALVLAFLFVSLNAGCKEQSAEKSGTDRFFITPTSIDATDNAFCYWVLSLHASRRRRHPISFRRTMERRGPNKPTNPASTIKCRAKWGSYSSPNYGGYERNRFSFCLLGRPKQRRESFGIVTSTLGPGSNVFLLVPGGCCMVSNLDRSHPRGRHNSGLSGNWEPGARTAQSVL